MRTETWTKDGRICTVEIHTCDGLMDSEVVFVSPELFAQMLTELGFVKDS